MLVQEQALQVQQEQVLPPGAQQVLRAQQQPQVEQQRRVLLELLQPLVVLPLEAELQQVVQRQEELLLGLVGLLLRVQVVSWVLASQALRSHKVQLQQR